MSLESCAKFIIETLKHHGYEAFYVGGCVRDQLLGVHFSDIDIATSAPSKIVQSLFKKTIPVGIKFGIIVVVEDGFNFEVATFRKDKDYIDGRHPEEVEIATLEEDVTRRDFTINGLYFDPLENKLYDFIEGKKDLNNKLIKAIGDPLKRFEEDHLRMIRACRYAACLNFFIEEKTKEAIIKMAPICHEGVSIERIIQELEKMHAKGCLHRGLKLMHELHVLKAIFPALSFDSDQALEAKFQKIGELKKDIPLIFPLFILFNLKTKSEIENLCNKFKLSNEALKLALSALEFKSYRSLKNIDLARLFSLPYFEQLQNFEVLFVEDKQAFLNFICEKQKQLKPVIHCFISKEPVVKAKDLESFNIPKGPIYKKLLDTAMSYYADHPSFSKEKILEHIMSFIPKG
jgi:poly(A) polymerase